MIFTTSHKARSEGILSWCMMISSSPTIGDPVLVHAEEINAWHVAVTRARRIGIFRRLMPTRR